MLLQQRARFTLRCSQRAVKRAVLVRTCAQHGQLVDWIKTLPKPEGQEVPSLTLAPSAAGGLGLHTPVSLKRGQVVLTVPYSAMLTSDSARESLGDQLADALPEWPLLCVHLLAERARGKDSKWHAYLSSLPDQSSHPMLWTEEVQEALLKGSPMYDTLRRRREEARSNLAEAIAAGAADVLRARLALADPEASVLTEANILWASATLLSRSFYLDMEGYDLGDIEDEDEGARAAGGGDGEDDEEIEAVEISADDLGVFDDDSGLEGRPEGPTGPRMCLVPWADMVNHDSAAGSEAELKYDPGLRCAVLRAYRDYAAGAEVFDSYGSNRSASELLLDFGFVDSANTNRWVEVPLVSIAASPKRGNQRLIDMCLSGVAGGAGATGVGVVLDEGGPDPSVMSWLRAAHASLEDLQRAGWEAAPGARAREKGFSGKSPAPRHLPPPSEDEDPREAVGRALMVVAELEEPAGPGTEARALDALAGHMDRWLAGYPTRPEEDSAFLRGADSAAASGPTSGSLLPPALQSDPRWRSVEVYVRRALLSEKRALEGTKAVAQKWLAAVRRGVPPKKVMRVRGRAKSSGTAV